MDQGRHHQAVVGSILFRAALMGWQYCREPGAGLEVGAPSAILPLAALIFLGFAQETGRHWRGDPLRSDPQQLVLIFAPGLSPQYGATFHFVTAA